MQNITISTSATMPTTIDMFEDGDPANTATGTLIAQPIANAIGYLKKRVGGIGGVLTTDGLGGVAITSSTGGFTAAISGDYIRITFTVAKASANFAVIGACENDEDILFKYKLKTTTTVDLGAFGSAATLDLGAVALSLSFMVFDFT